MQTQMQARTRYPTKPWPGTCERNQKMPLSDLLNSGSIPLLETAVKFAAQRQKMIAHNIANIETPGFLQVDVSISGFRKLLSEAVDRRREARGDSAPFVLGKSSEIRQTAAGDLILDPRTPSGGILAHDRNNRDLERLMQAQVENAGSFRVATDLLRTRFDLLKVAISQRS